VSDLYIPTIGLPILLEETCRPILELYKSLTDVYMNVEIGAVSDLYIPTIGLPLLLEETCRPILELFKSLTDVYMNVEIGAEAALFQEKEYISGIFVAVC
jgi:hypothetical protein